MTKFTYTAHDGTQTVIQADPGDTVMSAAKRNGVPGIVGECGGVLSCATCHIFVDPADLDRLPAITDLEDEMLEGTAVDREPTSRLACQVHATDDLETLEITTPEYQE
jgi:2Fe-2S ferredoxin